MLFGLGIGLGFGFGMGGDTAAPDVTVPTLSGLSTNAAGTKVIGTCSETLATGSVPATSAFTLIDAADITIASVAIVGATFELTLSAPIVSTDAPRLSYVVPVSNSLQDAAGNLLAAFTKQSVTNITSAAFAPTDYANLIVRFDPQDGASVTLGDSNTTYAAILNKVSSASYAEATNRPAYSATGFGGHPAMNADGTNDNLSNAEAAVYDALEGAVALSVYIVHKADNADALGAFFGTASTAASANSSRYWGQNTTGLGCYIVTARSAAAASVTQETFPGSVDTQLHSLCVRHTTTTTTLQVDRAADKLLDAVAFAPGSMTSNMVAFFNRKDSVPDSFFDGLIGEVLVYTATHTDAQAMRVQRYLCDKWTIPTTIPNIFPQGDSIPNGFGAGGQNVATLLATYYGGSATVTNLCTDGRQAAQVLASDMPAEVVNTRKTGNPLNIMPLLIGSNDLATAGRTTAQVLSDIAAIVALARLYQIKTVVGTLLYRDASGFGVDGSFNTHVDTINAALMTNAGGIYGDYIVDTHTAIVNAGGYPTVYSDSTHMNATGEAILGSTFAAGVDLVLAAA
jgi:hypothetical protein